MHRTGVVRQNNSTKLERDAEFPQAGPPGKIMNARRRMLFHLWWHPHNFGADPEANLLFLRQILDRYAILRDRFGMRSLNMSEVAERVLQ